MARGVKGLIILMWLVSCGCNGHIVVGGAPTFNCVRVRVCMIKAIQGIFQVRFFLPTFDQEQL